MKNYISKATLALLVALSATGCSDFLDEKLKSELAPDNKFLWFRSRFYRTLCRSTL